MTAQAPAVEVEGLHHAHPDGTVALRGVSLRVEPGERVALLGPNGAGKSTLARHLNGLVLAQRGTVRVHGHSPDDGEHLYEIRRRVQLLFQDPNDQLFMPSVGEDVAFGPRNLGFSEDEVERRVRGALAAVGLSDVVDRAPHHLSGGEQRRAALAGVLAMEPDVLVLDEPTAGLDPVGRRQLHEVLATLTQTQLVITHDLPFAALHCERAVLLCEGVDRASGPIGAVLENEVLLAESGLELPFGFSFTTKD